MASLIASSRPLCTLTTYQRLLLGLGCGGVASASALLAWGCSAAGSVVCGGPAGAPASGCSSAGTGDDVCSGWALSGGGGGVTAGVGSGVETFSVMTPTL